jgi:hypothetical protein
MVNERLTVKGPECLLYRWTSRQAMLTTQAVARAKISIITFII